MSFHNLLSVDFNSSQKFFAQKCISYLTLMNRDAEVIKDFSAPKAGHCLGQTVLNLYSLFIQLSEPRKKKSAPRDDWDSLKISLTRIAKWNEERSTLIGRASSRRKLRRSFERYISLIRHLQGELHLDDHPQMAVQQRLQNTKDMKFKREYSLAALLKRNELVSQLAITENKLTKITTLLDEVILEHRMVIFNSNDHVVGVLRHKHYYFAYHSNPEPKAGWTIFQMSQKEALSEYIFTAFSYPYLQLSHIGVTVIYKDDPQINPDNIYFSQAVLLDFLYPEYRYEAEDKDKTNCFAVAIDLHCYASLDYYLSYPSRILKKFLSANPDHLPPLILASKEKNGAPMVKTLLEAGAYSNCKNIYDSTPLHKAAYHNQLETMQLLVQYNANVNAINMRNETPLSIAIDKKHIRIINYLLSVPFLCMTKKNYQDLNSLAKAYPEDDALSSCLMNAHPVYFLNLIKAQLHKVQKTHPTYFKKAMLKLCVLAQEIHQPGLNCKAKISYIFNQMFPFLQDASLPKRHLSLWDHADLTKAVLTFTRKFGINKPELSQAELKKFRPLMRIASYT